MKLRHGMMAVLMCVALGLAAGCSWTVSSDRQRRISDCIRRCDSQAAAQPPRAASGDNIGRDYRSPCERECHATR